MKNPATEIYCISSSMYCIVSLVDPLWIKRYRQRVNKKYYQKSARKSSLSALQERMTLS